MLNIVIAILMVEFFFALLGSDSYTPSPRKYHFWIERLSWMWYMVVPYRLHHPSGVGIDGVVKFFRLIFFSVMCCGKFVLRNVTLGPLFQKRYQARQ